jgi:hypothetical protein
MGNASKSGALSRTRVRNDFVPFWGLNRDLHAFAPP